VVPREIGRALAGREPAAPGEEVVQDGLVDVGAQVVDPGDLRPGQPDPGEHVLHDVLGTVVVQRQPSREPDEPGPVREHERLEGVLTRRHPTCSDAAEA
jgi:hypothetical protein